MRIGAICRVDNGGLGSLTYDFWKHILEIKKELVITITDREHEEDLTRYPKAIFCNRYPTLEQIDFFLEDIDIVLIFETAYNWNIISKAREKGIKSVLMPMYEWSPYKLPTEPDLYLCPSKLDYDIFPEPKKYLPVPIDRKLFKFKQRTKAQTFVFNNGHGGSNGRNGLEELLEAIPLIKSDIKILIRSQLPILEINDPRVETRVANLKNRADLYQEGDVFLFPHKFNGLSLPIQEALSCGMPILSTDFYPHNTYLPKKWLFKAKGFEKGQVNPASRIIDVAQLSPENIALKIDEFANKDITEDSQKANEIAEAMSWDKLHKDYIKLFKELLEKPLKKPLKE